MALGPLVLVFIAFAGINFFLWSLPLTQMQLFLISLPLGAAAFGAFIWYLVRRE